jgi:hypothetical protein
MHLFTIEQVPAIAALLTSLQVVLPGAALLVTDISTYAQGASQRAYWHQRQRVAETYMVNGG